MDKLTLAHEWAMKHGSAMTHKTVIDAWAYADAMQAEADERNKAEAEQKRKEMREMLNAPNTFIEREGQHFDDVNWQPDWSKAPKWANWWAIRQDSGDALWCVNKPTCTDDCLMSHGACSPAPSFGFTGTYIVERPHGF